MPNNIQPNKLPNQQLNQQPIYDLIIVGSGPAGLTASIYASRYRLKHLVIGKTQGGEMALSGRIENYPGFKKISGVELAKKMAEHVQDQGGKIVSATVIGVKQSEGEFEIRTDDGKIYQSKTLIIASGTERRKLNIPGEGEYVGRGVSYCATCDGPLFKDKTIAVIGGGNAAVGGAVQIADYAQKIYLIYRREKEKMPADPVWKEEFEKKLKEGKIIDIYQTNLTEIKGDGQKVTSISLDKPYQGSDELKVDGVFIEVGSVPTTNLVKNLGVETDEAGYIKVNPDQSTGCPGIFAAGDITTGSNGMQQIVTATAEGAIAAASVYQYLHRGQAPTPSWGKG